jgi:hypothetical protein
LTTTPRRAAPRQPRHDGDRRGDKERAWGGDDEYRDRADRVGGKPPSAACQRQRERHERDGEPVGKPDERRTGRLRLLHQPYHTGIRRLVRGCRSEQLERLPGVDDAAAHVLARPVFDWQRLAGQRRLVEHARLQQPAVDRDDLAGPDEQPVAADHRTGRHLLNSVPDPPGGAW